MMNKYVKLTTSYEKLKDSVDKLERENALLKEKQDLQGTFVRHNGAYYFETPDGRDAPFCSRCGDMDGKLVKLQVGPNGLGCPRCSS